MNGKIIGEKVEENVSKRLISSKKISKLEYQMSGSVHNIKHRYIIIRNHTWYSYFPIFLFSYFPTFLLSYFPIIYREF